MHTEDLHDKATELYFAMKGSHDAATRDAIFYDLRIFEQTLARYEMEGELTPRMAMKLSDIANGLN